MKMSCICGIGGAPASSYAPPSAPVAKLQVPSAPLSAPATSQAGNDADRDGDTDGGGVDISG
jgi:hypothetical protein